MIESLELDDVNNNTTSAYGLKFSSGTMRFILGNVTYTSWGPPDEGGELATLDTSPNFNNPSSDSIVINGIHAARERVTS